MRHTRYLLIFLSAVMITASCSENKRELIVFHAGSLSMPFKAIADSFMQINPDVQVLCEASGSVDAARKITELRRDCDIMASADYSIIDKLLIPDYATDNIHFAANEMALVYTDKSKLADKIDTLNWLEILADQGVYTGRSDPDADPCGYRTILTLDLAVKYYTDKGYDDLDSLTKNILSASERFIRPKEVDLLALLETGSVDYIFLYKSVAIQHNLRYLTLPSAINMSDPQKNNFYKEASVSVRGSKPGEKIQINGEAMVYGVTILNNAPNKEDAQAFLDFLRSDTGGKKILNQMGQRAL